MLASRYFSEFLFYTSEQAQRYLVCIWNNSKITLVLIMSKNKKLILAILLVFIGLLSIVYFYSLNVISAKTFSNDELGISFAYPSSVENLVKDTQQIYFISFRGASTELGIGLDVLNVSDLTDTLF